jgi:MFS family permease
MSSDARSNAGRYALALLLVLTVINFLNYLDRYVLSAVLEGIREDLGFDDGQGGRLGSVFMVVYTLAAPLGGYIGDRWNRNRMAGIGVALWSLATIGSGMADSYESLLATRALIGIGEAGYATVAPSIIADVFRPSERGRKLAIFYMAIPMGSALGYLLGGAIGGEYGWRAAFYVAGAPGLVFALVAFFLPHPERGAMDEGPTEPSMPFMDGVRRLFRTPAWRINTIGMTLMTFAMGGIAFWMPTYLIREQGMEEASGNMIFGGITVVAGLLATLIGGTLGDRAFAKKQGGYFSVSGVGLLLGAPFALAMPLMPNTTAVFACAFAAEFLLFLNTGPLNAALVACVPASLRARSMALNVFFIHILGDALSPALIGEVSEARGLSFAVALTSIPVALGGLVLVRGARRVNAMPDGLATVDAS